MSKRRQYVIDTPFGRRTFTALPVFEQVIDTEVLIHLEDVDDMRFIPRPGVQPELGSGDQQ
ncbi:hypothetical protein [Mycolicibacterium sp.]|uniref:hypothetical protein n=1 Tax=Mycolicibacterium sp. TaxID=2320850 RepID=UPI0037C705FB